MSGGEGWGEKAWGGEERRGKTEREGSGRGGESGALFL
jgi:hypothetical protein